MTSGKALLTASLGPVHGFIAQARRLADLWAGSDLLSHLAGTAIRRLWEWTAEETEMVFPSFARHEELPPGITNRFVCRVPASEADGVALALEESIRAEWDRLVEATVKRLGARGIVPEPHIWQPGATRGERQTDHLFEVAWSWVPENGSYATAAVAGARQFAAARRFRPFAQIEEHGEKCALCGERTALPDGNWRTVRASWLAAEEQSKGTEDEPYFRFDQSRLCLVCATKRLYPLIQRDAGGGRDRSAFFSALDSFQPGEKDSAERDGQAAPYFAVVKMDGDRMGEILGWPERAIAGGDVEGFHREVSRVLSDFAEGLRTPGEPLLNLDTLGRAPRKGRKRPQLIYAGGEDVLFVCDPRDALRLAWLIQDLYRRCFADIGERLTRPADAGRFTISAAVIFAHARYPAGLLFAEAERLLKEKAKGEAQRDAVAVRLAKRGGVPLEVAFKWNAPAGSRPETWTDAFDDLVDRLAADSISSRQTFTLRRDDATLTEVLSEEQWAVWLADRLSRREAAGTSPAELGRRLAPFFKEQKSGALRIARFLVTELGEREAPEAGAEERAQ